MTEKSGQVSDCVCDSVFAHNRCVNVLSRASNMHTVGSFSPDSKTNGGDRCAHNFYLPKSESETDVRAEGGREGDERRTGKDETDFRRLGGKIRIVFRQKEMRVKSVCRPDLHQ